MTVARRLVPLAVLTAAFGVALLLAPGVAATWAHVYLIALSAGVLALGVRSVARARKTAAPSVVDVALAQRRRSPAKPEDLERLERLVTLGSSSAFDLHYRLRPALREIAGGILLGRGIDLDAPPGQAREALGEDAWEILRPDRAAPVDRQAGGLAPAGLQAVVQGIEGAR